MRHLIVTGAVCLGFAGTAHGGVVLEDGFEYVDQPAFEASWPAVTTSGILDSSRAATGAKSVTIPASATNRNGRSITELGNPSQDNAVTWSFDFFDSNAALSPYRQSSNLQDSASPTGSGQLVSMGMNNNLTSAAEGGNFYMARILGFNGGAYFKLNEPGAPLRSTGWHNLKVVIDDTRFQFYVDNILSETVSQTGLTLRSYDTLRLGSGVTSTAEAGFDNMFVSTGPVPEPTSLAALAVVSGGLLARRRRQA